MPLPPELEVRFRRVRVRRRRIHGRHSSLDRRRHFILSIFLGTCTGLLMSLGFFLEYEQKPTKVVVHCEAASVKCLPSNCFLGPGQVHTGN